MSDTEVKEKSAETWNPSWKETPRSRRRTLLLAVVVAIFGATATGVTAQLMLGSKAKAEAARTLSGR